jgi:hypothetical protein
MECESEQTPRHARARATPLKRGELEQWNAENKWNADDAYCYD